MKYVIESLYQSISFYENMQQAFADIRDIEMTQKCIIRKQEFEAAISILEKAENNTGS